jgi:hypothetical protein
MGLLTDPIMDVDEARKALRWAERALSNAIGSPEFRNYDAACDALDHVEKASAALVGYPTHGIDDD